MKIEEFPAAAPRRDAAKYISVPERPAVVQLSATGAATGSTSLIALPMSAGLFTTLTPAAVSAAIFSAAVPLPPAMIAPAWPMRRPGGAVWPAMKPTTGFLKCRLDPGGGFFLGAAADLADHDHRVGVRILARTASARRCGVVPISGSPPMPMQVVWPMPSRVSWWIAS